MKKIKLLDTFSGIGGFKVAQEIVGGFETTQFVENDPYCQKVLKKHWPHIPIHDDIRTFTAEPFQYDAVCGGFPCQDVSTAGRGKGITQETRSGLFYELMRVIRMVRPKYVILENVAAILNNGLDIVLGELSQAGYDAEWAVISASSLGACHRRSRWWLVAYPKSQSSNGSKFKSSVNKKSSISKLGNSNVTTSDPNNNGLPSAEKSRSIEKTDGRAEERKNQTCQSQGSSESKNSGDIQLSLANTESIGHGRRDDKRCKIQERQFLSGEQERREVWDKTKGCDNTSSNSDSLRTQSKDYKPNNASWKMPVGNGKTKRTLNPNWRQYVSQPTLRRGDDGLRNRVDRLKALGNAVVPQVAAIPLQRVKDFHEQLTSVDR